MEKAVDLFLNFVKTKSFLAGMSALIGVTYLLRKFFNGPECSVNDNNLNGKLIIITGANSGIGLETAKLVLEKGACVVFACRDEKRTLAVIKKTIKPIHQEKCTFIRCDMANLKSIIEFKSAFDKKFGKFDILINNAGAMFNSFEKNEEGVELTLATNHIGGLFLTLILLRNINPEGRVIHVNSSLLKNNLFNIDEMINDLSFKRLEGNYEFVKQYSYSKQCQYAFSKFLNSEEMKKKLSSYDLNFKSVCLHPGVIITEAQSKFKGFFLNLALYLIIPFSYLFTKSLFYGAQTTMHTVLEKYSRLKDGKFYSDCSEKILPGYLEEENYWKALLNYTFLLIEKYYYIKKLPEEIRECVELMKSSNY